MRLRELKQWGDSFVIMLKPQDLKDMKWKVGMSFDVDDLAPVRVRKVNNG